MEQWSDQGIVLAVRGHGESGAVVSLLTEHHGRHAGYFRGAKSSRNRGTLEPGNLADAHWQSRIADNLGTLTLELSQSYAPRVMNDPLRLAALKSACALCDAALPEREGHPGLFYGFVALLETLESEHWAAAYVMWEISLLKELGFSLELSKCAGGGDGDDLEYVSPKTGRAVSKAEGAPYKEKLLLLADFLKPCGGDDSLDEVCKGLEMTGHFLEHWAFTHHTHGIPEARGQFINRFNSLIEHNQKTLVI